MKFFYLYIMLLSFINTHTNKSTNTIVLVPMKTQNTIVLSHKKNLYVIIKKYEGVRLHKYYDGNGKDNRGTIGYGHLIKSNENIPNVISEDYAMDLLYNDVKYIYNYISNRFPDLHENQKCALVDFAFNLGIGTLSRSTIPNLIKTGEYDKVPNEIIQYCYYNGKVHRGLKERRMVEIKMWNQCQIHQ